MKILGFISIFFLLSSWICAQNTMHSQAKLSENDSIIKTYNSSRIKLSKFEDMSRSQNEKASFYAKNASVLLDSAALMLKVIPYLTDKKKIAEMNYSSKILYDLSSKSYANADMYRKSAVLYADSAAAEKLKIDSLLNLIHNQALFNSGLGDSINSVSDLLILDAAINGSSQLSAEQISRLSKLSMPSTYVVLIGEGDVDMKKYSKVKNIQVYKTNRGNMLYTVGEFITSEDAKEMRDEMAKSGFPDCSIRQVYKDNMKLVNDSVFAAANVVAEPNQKEEPKQAVKNDKNTDSGVYVVQIAEGDLKPERYSKISDLKIYLNSKGVARYTVGEFQSAKEAESLKNEMVEKGYKDAYIRKIYPSNLKLVK